VSRIESPREGGVSTLAQVWLMRGLSVLSFVAVVAVMTAAAWAGEVYWGFR